MDVIQWVSLVGGITGTGLGIFNAVVSYRRGVVRLKVTGYTQKGDDGVRRLRIEIVNTGGIPVTVKKVLLTVPSMTKTKLWQLWEHNSRNARLPVLLKQGETVLLVIHRDAVKKPFMLKCLTVVAQTADGRRIKGRSTGLRELADELELESALKEHARQPATDR